MADVALKDPPKDPDFISYLLSPDLSDCYFLVGNRNLIEPEKIGVVRKMLCAHSPVLRAELYESKNAEKGTVYVEDLFPDTFKHLLRFFYGYDNTKTLGFNEADNLLYAAEKYMVEPLKGRLAERLASLLNTDNICSLLNNPACFKALESKTALSRLLQFETDKVLTSPQFVDITTDGFLKILEQDAMNVPEIEVWRAALKWAKHQTNTNSGDALRKQLEKPLKYIRFCTLDMEALCREVFPTGVLTEKEVSTICIFKGNKENTPDLDNISSELTRRSLKSSYVSRYCNIGIYFSNHSNKYFAKTCVMDIITNCYAVELPNLRFTGKLCPSKRVPEGASYECKYTITITRVTNFDDNTSSEAPVVFENNGPFIYNKGIIAPLEKDGKRMLLLPYNKYSVKVEFSENVIMYRYQNSKDDPYGYDMSVYPYKLPGGLSTLMPTTSLSYYIMNKAKPSVV